MSNSEFINWRGTITLSMREIQRFMRVYNQTIIAPAITALIFLSIFVLATGNSRPDIHGIKFINFISYGLIMMSIVQNSFANSSSSLIMSKVLGYISDILFAPFSSTEIIVALTAGAVIRGIIVGIVVALFLIPFIDFTLYHPYILLFFAVFSCIFLGQLGIFAGIFAKSFDQSAAITSYIITPLSFLSGTFYSVNSLPPILQKVNNFNPFFYMIDGFRYSLTNHADSDITKGMMMIILINICIFIFLKILLDSGWRIKS